MATFDTTPDFGEVSRLKGVVFEYIALGASLLGIIALAVLLVYVIIDAFDLANASPEWLFTYLGTLGLPFIAFCLYSTNDPALTKRAIAVLVGGLIVTPLGFLGIEHLLRPIPGLTWPLTYLFIVVTPLTGYLIVTASRNQVGQIGFSLLGRLIGGLAIGFALSILFLVFDPRLWFLTYTVGVLPAVLVAGYARLRARSRISLLPVPVGLGGVVLAVALRGIVDTYPIPFVLYAWSLAIPIALAGGAVLALRGRPQGAALVSGLSLLIAIGGGLAADAAGHSGELALLVLVTVSVPTTVYLYDAVTNREGLIGVLLPLILIGGIVAGTVIVQALGVPAPDPWLDLGFITSPHSRTPAEAGLYPAIVGSVIIIALVAILSFALGVGTAVFLEEYTAGSGLTGMVTRVIQVNIANLAAVPSVVYGLLGLGLFANLLGFGFGTAVTAALTLSLLILPITIISAQEAIRSVPNDLRRGSDAMGATRWQTTRDIVLPQALPGILTGTILALGRAIGETAPLIMIGAATTVFSPPSSIWSKFSAMPMQIFAWSDFPQEEFRYGVVAAGVVTLLVVLLSMNATAIIIRNRAERNS